MKTKQIINELIASLFEAGERLNSFGCENTGEVLLKLNGFQISQLMSAIESYYKKMKEYHDNSGIYPTGRVNEPGVACQQWNMTGKIMKHLDVIISQIHSQWPNY